jgi:hypothetical protein
VTEKSTATRILRSLAALALPAVLIAGAITAVAVVTPSPGDSATAATSATDFQAGNIISDATFANTATMTAAQIQTFLNQKVATCTTGYTCLRNYSQATASRAADSYCKAYTGSRSETAASIISKVATACGINPQVLLVTLQKEEGLVLSSRPSSGYYTIAMGYGCPDTAACNSLYYGFFNQVYSAAHQFQVYAKNPTYFRYRAGYTNTIQYNPSASCGTASVFIQNQATASLYNYTPYTPNQASLSAGYGSAACGAYGNRNFFLYFSDWFGNPANYLKAGSFEGRSTAGWAWTGGTMNRAVATSPTQAEDGSSFLAVNAPGLGRAASQTVTRSTAVGEQATATVWLRSADSRTYTGTVALTGLGGTTETASTSYSVGPKWTAFTVALPVRASAHTQLRFDVGLGTTAGTLWVDNAQLTFGAAPVLANALANPGFEGTFGGWTPGNGFMNRQVYKSPTQAQAGSWFAATNTPVAGRSFSQTVSTFGDPSTGYDFSIWLRSADARTFTGQVALWGLGGSKKVVSTVPYSVGKTWTKVTVALDPGAVVPTTLKAEVYLSTVQSQGTLWLDSGTLARNQITNASFEAGTTGWATTSKALSVSTGTATTLKVAPQAGGAAGVVSTTQAGASVSQTVAATPQVGDTYTAAVWVRSASGQPLRGRVAAWGLGGTTEGASQAFTAQGSWTQVTFALPIRNAGHTSLRLEIYDDTANAKLLVDSTRLW